MQQFQSFEQFYPFYLREHANPVCRALHYIGSSLVLLVLAYGIYIMMILMLMVLWIMEMHLLGICLFI